MSINQKLCEDLIVRHFDSALTVDEEKELAAVLVDSADAREMFARYMRLEGETIELALADCFDQSFNSTDDGSLVAKRNSRANDSRRSWWRSSAMGWTVLAVAVAVTVVAMKLGDNGFNGHTNDGVVNGSPQAVAHFTRLVNVKWPGEAEAGVGEAIYPGTIEIDGGLAEIEFENGAIVIVEGPMRLDVATRDRAFLHHGRLRSIVPPEAYGFTVESADVKVVDLGTEFGFEVDPDGLAEVHVFDGEIEMYEGTNLVKKRLLSAGQAIQIERTGWRREIPADQRAFVDSETLEARAESYIARIRGEVRDLTKVHHKLLRDRKRIETALRQDQKLVELRAEADQARKAADDAMVSDPAVASVMKRRKEIQIQIDEQIRSRLSQTKPGKKLLNKLDQIEQQLVTLEIRVREARANVDARPKQKQKQRLRKLAAEIRDLNRHRSDVKARIRKAGGKLRRSDRGIRDSVARLNQVKRKLDATLRKSDVSKLRQASESKRKKFLSAQNRLLQNDAELVELRKQIGETSKLLRQQRKRIQQARKQDAEDFLMDGKLFESDANATESAGFPGVTALQLATRNQEYS